MTPRQASDSILRVEMDSVLRFALATYSMKRCGSGEHISTHWGATPIPRTPNQSPPPDAQELTSDFVPTRTAASPSTDDRVADFDMHALQDALHTCLAYLQETHATPPHEREQSAREHDEVQRMLKRFLMHTEAREVMLHALIEQLMCYEECQEEENESSSLLLLECVSRGARHQCAHSLSVEVLIHDSLLDALLEMQKQELEDSVGARWLARTIEDIQSLLPVFRFGNGYGSM